MPTTAITVITTLGAYGSYAANAADFTWTVADVANGNHYVSDGTEVVLVNNTHATLAKNVTVTSQPDTFGRTGHIASYSLGVGEFGVFGPFAALGWRNTQGQVLLSADDAAVKFAIIRSKKS